MTSLARMPRHVPPSAGSTEGGLLPERRTSAGGRTPGNAVRGQGCYHNVDAGALKEAFDIAIGTLPPGRAADAGIREALAASILDFFRKDVAPGEPDAFRMAEAGLEGLRCDPCPTEDGPSGKRRAVAAEPRDPVAAPARKRAASR